MIRNGKSIFKAGKLIKIDMEYDDSSNEIHKIKIHGDFFLYPEDAIENVQKQLIGIKLEKQELIDSINNILKNEKIESFGFTSEQLADAIIAAIKI